MILSIGRDLPTLWRHWLRFRSDPGDQKGTDYDVRGLSQQSQGLERSTIRTLLRFTPGLFFTRDSHIGRLIAKIHPSKGEAFIYY